GQSLLYTGYTYKGAKLDQWGRGFLGFYEVKATNLNTQIETINRHRQDFPFTGMVMESIQKIPDRVIDTLPDTDIVQFPGAIKPLTPSALPDGCKIVLPPPPEVIPGQEVSKTTNTFAAFEWSGRQFPYVKKSVALSFDLNSGATLKRTTTAYTYDSNGSNGTWGNPAQITVTVDDGSGGQRHVTRTVNQYT